MSKHVFDNDRNMYNLASLQLDVVADEETSPNNPLRSFKTVGKGGFGSIFVGSIWKRAEEFYQADPDYQLLGYYHDALLAVDVSNKQVIALKEQVSTTPVKVAVKRIDVMADYELLREASNLRVLWGRRNFVTIYGPTMSRDLKCVCLVMDFVQGCNLNEFLRSLGTAVFKLDWNDERARMCKLWESNEVLWWMEKLKLFREIVIALVVCHSQKVYHGDLKGANILLDKTLVPKIVDFGLSFRRADISYIREVGGSLFWAAPEVVDPPEGGTIHESEVVSDPYPSDIYSLGMVLAEMMLDGEVKDSFTDVELFICDKLDGGCPVSLDHVSSPDAMFNKRVLNRLKSLINCCCEAERADRMPLQKCLSEVNAVFSELHSFCSPSQCSILYERTDHDFIGTRAYRDVVLRFKERFPVVPEFMILSPSWNMVMDEENLLVHYFCMLDYTEGVQYIVEKSMWDFQPERDIPYMSLLCVTEESLETLRYLASSWPDAMKRQLLLLHKACLCDNPEVFRFLLVDVGIDFDTWNAVTEIPKQLEPLMKPIHKLAARGRKEMVKMILEKCEVEFSEYVNTAVPGSSGDGENFLGTPLYYAFEGGDHVETVRFLMDRGGTVSAKAIHRRFFKAKEMGVEGVWSALFFLAKYYDREKIEAYLVSRHERGVVVPEPPSVVLSRCYVRSMQTDTGFDYHEMQRYLDLAKPYVRNILSGFETGDSEEVKQELKKKMEFPSVLAAECCKKGYLGILQFLEDCGLDLNLYKEKSDAVDSFESLLHVAAWYGHVDVAKYLIDRGYLVNSSFESASSATPLLRACGSSISMHKKEMIAFLLEAGADPNYRDLFGYTAMDRVAGSSSKGSRELVRLLLEAGFDCGQKDRWGHDYLDHIARRGTYPDIPVGITPIKGIHY